MTQLLHYETGLCLNQPSDQEPKILFGLGNVFQLQDTWHPKLSLQNLIPGHYPKPLGSPACLGQFVFDRCWDLHGISWEVSCRRSSRLSFSALVVNCRCHGLIRWLFCAGGWRGSLCFAASPRRPAKTNQRSPLNPKITPMSTNVKSTILASPNMLLVDIAMAEAIRDPQGPEQYMIRSSTCFFLRAAEQQRVRDTGH